MERELRIFLTGGTGLIGSHVAEHLRARGQEVIALVRPDSDRRHLVATGCRLVEGDLLDSPDRLAGFMRGCDAVVHAAALVFHRAARSEFQRINVAGTRSVLGAAALAAPRVVHLSSVAVYSRLRPDPLLREESWTAADPAVQGAYAASKTESERAAWAMHEGGEVQLTTVRPAVVYGERDRAATPWMIRLARLPVLPFPGGGRSRLPLVYAGNVARGVLAALDREHAVGRAYNLAEDHPVTGRELVRLLAGALQRRPRILHVPVTPVRGLARALYAVTRWTPLPTVDLRRGIRTLTRDNPYDSSRARLELGWKDLTPPREAVGRAVAWWRAVEEENEQEAGA
jgi:2-alkyl-3-oxoalkanoate reductase